MASKTSRTSTTRSSARRRNRPYGLLARFYDQIMGDLVPGMSRHAREKILAKEWRKIGSVLELACGSGATAVDLAKKGLDVEATDLSPAFVAQTRRRAKAAGVALRVSRGDMRSLPRTVLRRLRARPVDLVLCEFSALNNLADRRDLAPVIRTAAQALAPGGLFLFDIDTPFSFKTKVATTMWEEKREFALLLRATVEPDCLNGRVDFDWFLPAQRGTWRRAKETIHHVTWSEAEIRRALRAAGFKSAKTFDGVDVRPPMEGAVRGTDLYFLARR